MAFVKKTMIFFYENMLWYAPRGPSFQIKSFFSSRSQYFA